MTRVERRGERNGKDLVFLLDYKIIFSDFIDWLSGLKDLRKFLT